MEFREIKKQSKVEMKQKVLLLIALLCTFVQGTRAQNTENVTFNVRSWDETNKKVVTKTETKSCKILSGYHSDDWLAISGYYVVVGEVVYKTLNVFGEAHIILSDNATLTCTGGILVVPSHDNASLSIYSQSDGNKQGKLIVTNSYKRAAGIGSSNNGESNGKVTIHGGVLDVTGAQYGAGIGTGQCKDEETDNTAGKVIIYGGTVKAHGGDSGAGIGGGAGHNMSRNHGGELVIYDGEVTATGGEFAAGVGGGGAYGSFLSSNSSFHGGSGGNVDIYGGTLTVQGGEKAAGIGCGLNATAQNSFSTNAGTVNIYDGTVTATGGKRGAGIGGGYASYYTHGTVNIYGGKVTARGDVDAAGIGGGEISNGITVNISGGEVLAVGNSYGAGIGGGEYTDYYKTGCGGDVTITGGTVIAIAGNDCKARESDGGSAIGCGQGISGKEEKSKKLDIADNMMVTGGDSETNIERVFTSTERVPACRWRNYVRIEACTHTAKNGDAADVATTYTIDDEFYHTKHCRYCNVTIKEMHSGEDCVCGRKNQYEFTLYVPDTEKNSYKEGSSTTVGAGKNFYLPECSNVPAGYIFAGWEMNPDPEEPNGWADAWSHEFIQPQTAVEAMLGMDNAKFYARFIYDLKWECMWDESNPTTGTTVFVSHPDLTPHVLTAGSHYLTITSMPLKDEKGNEIGTHYEAVVNYELKGYSYSFKESKDIYNTINLELASNGDNQSILEENANRHANVTLKDRTLYKDGSWNTLCLPFNLSDLSDTPLQGATLKTLASSEFDEGTKTLKLNFVDAETIEAGKPYFVKWSDETGEIHNPVFNNVVIINNVGEVVSTDNVKFIGLTSLASLETKSKSVLYLGSGNSLYYPSADMTIGAFRAYFQLAKNLINSSIGNVNGDRDIDISDVVAQANHILGINNSSFIIENADLNGDGGIDISDVVALVNIILGSDNSMVKEVVSNLDNLPVSFGGGSGPAR